MILNLTEENVNIQIDRRFTPGLDGSIRTPQPGLLPLKKNSIPHSTLPFFSNCGGKLDSVRTFLEGARLNGVLQKTPNSSHSRRAIEGTIRFHALDMANHNIIGCDIHVTLAAQVAREIVRRALAFSSGSSSSSKLIVTRHSCLGRSASLLLWRF